MARRFEIGNVMDPEIYEHTEGRYVLYSDYARLEEELDRVKQCYLTLRESKAKRKDYETELACGSSDILRVECKKMVEMREALREAESNIDFLLDIAAQTPERFARADVESIAESLAKIREVLGDE